MSVETEENHEKSQSGQSMSRLRFEPNTSITAMPTCSVMHINVILLSPFLRHSSHSNSAPKQWLAYETESCKQRHIGPETSFVALRVLKAGDNKTVRDNGNPLIFEEKETGGWRKLHNEELHNLYSSPSTRIIK
jgi:hypothetical protein